ncbi:MAG: aldo/keto reductase [Firmicutes bacterium]|nr:aldo/keto reductase [Bacillota bacterium]
MQYKDFGKLGFQTSVFGMGCMRLPEVQTPEGRKVDEAEAIKMIRYALDHGVNYLDTAYGYHDGTSERIVGQALQDGYREKTKLATKLPLWRVETLEDAERIFEEQLTKLQVESVDFYLLHAVKADRWQKVQELKILEFLEELRKAGKIKYIGFSFHDQLEVFKEVIDAYPWDMCQIQLNILDEEFQAGVEGLRYAGTRGIPVVIMEPLKGGKLAQNIPADVLDLWATAPVKRSPVEWAFRWLYNYPEVTVILSGVSSMAQLQENIRIFAEARSHSMTPEELDLVRQVISLYASKTKVPCTECGYCLPCPQEVAIPRIFRHYNEGSIFEQYDESSRHYQELIAKAHDASVCVECGACEQVCPQGIRITEQLKAADQALR